MKHISISGTARNFGKKADVKSLRRENKVPCVVYGAGIENVAFALDLKDFESIVNTPNTYIIDLTIDGKAYMTVLHDVQYHPVTDMPLHADFLAITAEKPIVVSVPIAISGNSEGVKQGGKLAVNVRKLKVCGTEANLPDVVNIDITELRIGKTIKAGDLNFDNFSIVNPKSTIICAVKMTRAAAAASEK